MNVNFDNEFKSEIDRLEVLIKKYEMKLKQLETKQAHVNTNYINYKKKLFKRQRRIESYERELFRLDNYISSLIEAKADLEYKLVNQKLLGKMSRTLEMINTNVNIMLQKK